MDAGAVGRSNKQHDPCDTDDTYISFAVAKSPLAITISSTASRFVSPFSTSAATPSAYCGGTATSSSSSSAAAAAAAATCEPSRACPVGELLAAVRDELFASPELATYLAELTGHALATVSAECRRFRPGLDYTLAHYGLLRPEPRLDASLCCAVAEGTKKQARQWASGDVGGFLCYIKADLGQEDATAAESYRRPDRKALQQQGDEAGEEEDVLSVFAASNALSLVLRRPNAMRFVKYVSASAPSSRWDVAAEFGLRASS